MKKVICFQARLERDTRLDYKRIGNEKNFNDLLEISNANNGLRDEQLIKMFKRLSQEKEGAC